MKDSLMYKMSYYRFPELYGQGQAVDRVRQQVIPPTPIRLNTIGKPNPMGPLFLFSFQILANAVVLRFGYLQRKHLLRKTGSFVSTK